MAVCQNSDVPMLMPREPLACHFDDGVEALDYWRRRRARLAWHRRSARREADAMVEAWERRIRDAVLLDATLPMDRRLKAGWLVVRTRGAIIGRRWRRRAYAMGMAMAAVTGACFALIAQAF